ncbi:hypothetical protein AB0J09_62115, partial [Nonomuraea sp. NPDC049784]
MTLIKRMLAYGMAAALVALGAAAPAVASAPRVEDLGVPLEDVLLIGGVVAPGPGGRTVLWGASSGSPAHLNAVDPATGAEVA